MELDEFWAHQATEQSKNNATLAQYLQEQHGPVPSLQNAYASTRKPLEPKQERSSENYALAVGLPSGDPLRVEAVKKHHNAQ